MKEKVVFNIRKFSDKETSKVVELLSNIWNLPTKKEIESRFSWQYKINPFQTEERIYLAFYKEKLIGIRAFVPLEAIFYEKKLDILCPSDALVHPEYRNRGVFSLLNNAFIADLASQENTLGCVLNLSSNEASLKGNLKKGWVETNSKRTNVYRFSFFSLTSKIFNIQNKNKFDKSKKDNIHCIVTKELKIDSILDLRKHSQWNEYISINRNLSYYEWRYVNNPEDFYYGYLYENDKISSYLILKAKSNYIFEIEEYYSLKPENLKILLKHIQISLKIPMIKMKAFSENQIKYSNKIGLKLYPFILEKIFRKNKIPILVRSFKKYPDEKDYIFFGKDIRDMNNWILYNSDYN